MAADFSQFIARLNEAASTFNQQGAAAVCHELIEYLRRTDETISSPDAKKLLVTLRRKRLFGLMEVVADALIQSGHDQPSIRRLYAQALIDRGNLTAAIDVLEKLLVLAAAVPEELREARGLLGRVFKQIYVNSSNPESNRAREALAKSLSWYFGVYDGDREQLWHGVNVAALLCRAKRHGIEVPGYPKPDDIARQVIASVEKRAKEAGYGDLASAAEASLVLNDKDAGYWDLASAAEASLVLNDLYGALAWLGRYLRAKDTDAFELASTHRQFVEVWQLNVNQDPGLLLLPLLRERLLRKQGGFVELTVSDLLDPSALLQHQGKLQLVLGSEWFKNLQWYDTGRDRCRSVARIGTLSYKGIGTGFLIRGSELAEALGDEFVVVTNAHVITNDPDVKRRTGALFPDEATVWFEALGRPTKRRFADVIWTSPPAELDATVVRLTAPVHGARDCPVRKHEPAVSSSAQAYVIGYPAGGDLSISLADNVMLGFLDPKLHYRSPTEPGHSGSPVFDNEWQLMGIHHAGFERTRLKETEEWYAANEGIWIGSVRRELKAFLAGKAIGGTSEAGDGGGGQVHQ